MYIFQDEEICNNFLKNIARICCRHKALPVKRFHGLADNYILDQRSLIRNLKYYLYIYNIIYLLLNSKITY